MKRTILAALAASTCLLAAVPASAAIIWTDWTSQGAGTVGGTVGGVGVTYTGSYAFTQLTGGTNYWSPWPVAGEQPTGTDIIALNLGGTKTITFASAVSDVYFALNSWNVPAVTGGPSTTSFDKPYSLIGVGCGYWGCGSLLSPTATTFQSNGSNEIHGIIKFAGPITSLTFTDGGDEFWHGFTIGIGSAAAVPEPATWAMMIGGFGVIGAALRRRRRAGLATA